jgi:peptide deformylase
VGLAAPQVGELSRLIVVKPPRGPVSAGGMVLVNPELRDFSADSVVFEEGCLSFPGLYIRLVRPRTVTVDYLDLDGRPRSLAADGLLARIIQHEVDHLDGVLFVDHLSPWHRRLLWWRLWRLRWR